MVVALMSCKPKGMESKRQQDMEAQYKQPICVIGMHRSGTSMVTRLLRLCGLDLGPDGTIMGASAGNAEGHFEHLGFVELNDALLEHFGGSWDYPPALEAGWERDPSLNNLTRQARVLIETFSGRAGWGWKDPRTTLLLPFWRQLIPNMRYVICLRSPLEVARSLAERDRMSIAGAAELWYHYSHKAICDTDNSRRIVSFYEDYFVNPLQELNRVAEFCGFATYSDAEAVQGIISGALRHQSTDLLGLLEQECIPQEYKLLYLGLRALSFEEASAKKRGHAAMEKTAVGATKLFELMKEFRATHRVAHLEARIAGMELLLKKSQATIGEREGEIARLEKENAQLRAFSEAVRKTWVYRSYRKLVWPFKRV